MNGFERQHKPSDSRTQRLRWGPAGFALTFWAPARRGASRLTTRVRGPQGTVALATQRTLWRAGGARCVWACPCGARAPAPPQPGRSPPGPSSEVQACWPGPRALRGLRRARELVGAGNAGSPSGNRHRQPPRPPLSPHQSPVSAADARR